MHQSRHRHVRILTTGIGHVVRGGPSLFNTRNDLPPDWIVWIFVARNEIKKMRSDGEREFVARKQNAAAFFIAKIDPAAAGLELNERGDPVLELPFPIVPKFRG